MIGTELTILPPETVELSDTTIERVGAIYTNATTDNDLVAVWIKAHAGGSDHTVRAYERIGARFVAALRDRQVSIAEAKVEDVQVALESLGTTVTGRPASAATLGTYIAAVKSLLGFAHRVGFTRFNAAPLIKIKRAPRKLAQKIISEADVELLLRNARSARDRLMIDVAYCGGLRVSELCSLTWSQIIPRDTGEVQLAIVGKGDKERNVLLPIDIATSLMALRADAAPTERLFPITERRFNYIVKATAQRAGINPEASAHWLRHAHASHSLDNGAPISLVSQTLGHASIKTTSVYSHAKPTDSSSKYLQRHQR